MGLNLLRYVATTGLNCDFSKKRLNRWIANFEGMMKTRKEGVVNIISEVEYLKCMHSVVQVAKLKPHEWYIFIKHTIGDAVIFPLYTCNLNKDI